MFILIFRDSLVILFLIDFLVSEKQEINFGVLTDVTFVILIDALLVRLAFVKLAELIWSYIFILKSVAVGLANPVLLEVN